MSKQINIQDKISSKALLADYIYLILGRIKDLLKAKDEGDVDIRLRISCARTEIEDFEEKIINERISTADFSRLINLAADLNKYGESLDKEADDLLETISQGPKIVD